MTELQSKLFYDESGANLLMSLVFMKGMLLTIPVALLFMGLIVGQGRAQIAADAAALGAGKAYAEVLSVNMIGACGENEATMLSHYRDWVMTIDQRVDGRVVATDFALKNSATLAVFSLAEGQNASQYRNVAGVDLPSLKITTDTTQPIAQFGLGGNGLRDAHARSFVNVYLDSVIQEHEECEHDSGKKDRAERFRFKWQFKLVN